MNSIALRSDTSIKVPIVITLVFWVIKILATTVGETGADFLAFNLNIGLAPLSLIMGVVLAGCLYAQLRSARYRPWLYWLTVAMVSIVGTLITDNLTDNLGVELTTLSLIFAVTLTVEFGLWYRSEGSLSIHSINSTRRELFYWTVILLTFALGTAVGDLLAETAGFGYALSGAIFATAILLIAVSFYLFRLNAILAFWLAYIITRPLGASIGDLLSQSPADGGLGLGTTVTSVLFAVAIVALVSYLTISRADMQARRLEPVNTDFKTTSRIEGVNLP